MENRPILISEIIGTKCEKCIKLKKNHSTDTVKCWVLQTPYFLLKMNECKYFCDDPIVYLDNLKDMRLYSKEKLGTTPRAIIREIERVLSLVDKTKYEGLRKIYLEEVHRPGVKFGGGDKSERTDKKQYKWGKDRVLFPWAGKE